MMNNGRSERFVKLVVAALSAVSATLGVAAMAAAQGTPWGAPADPYAPAPAPVYAPAPAPVYAPAPVAPSTLSMDPDMMVEASRPATAIEADPNADRAWVSPTAETQPKGRWAYNNYWLFLHGFSYGLTDSTQISALALPPYSDDQPLLVNMSLKQRVTTGQVKLAVTGSLWHFDDGDDFEGDDDGLTVGTVGATVSVCLDKRCHSQLGGNIDFIGSSETIDDPTDVFRVAAHGTFRLGKHAKAVLEIDGAGVARDTIDLGQGGIVFYGVRFHSKTMAADVGLARPFVTDAEAEEDNPFILGLPLLNFTYRPL